MEAIQFLQTTPDEFSEQLFNRFKNLLGDLKKVSPIPDHEELMTRTEVCKFLQIDSSTLWLWTKKGKLKGYGIGNRRYYKKKEILNSLVPLKIVT
ncbi:helix-turn-helix domain-containing protein [Polaribacter sp. IC073]|uniref:helix-turn-helix domain-containing protein n=1 Tax=Polaribacter sp. IC073 TaxID=2508540 RepID=UPI0011BF05FA|nr:helix-turn-helix domain-containing protein [Polaribacter sp. IC073]TXD48666.1 helix-turn-helix domain-containing protein [Polaribacter sp. IC073]